MNQLVSLLCCLIACGSRRRSNRQTDGRVDIRNYKYRNPRWACAPRVNKVTLLPFIVLNCNKLQSSLCFAQLFSGVIYARSTLHSMIIVGYVGGIYILLVALFKINIIFARTFIDNHIYLSNFLTRQFYTI